MSLTPTLNYDQSAVDSQALYLQLINNRSDKINNADHKYTVLSGYYHLMMFAMKPQVIAHARNNITIS